MKSESEVMKLNAKLRGDKQEWWMAKGMGTAHGPGDYPKLSVNFDNSGEFTFQIHNPSAVTFAATDAFGPKAQKANPNDFGDQFTVSGEGTKTLVVKDANSNKGGGHYKGGDYNYQLRFSDGSTLDPIISNGGCCVNKSSYVWYAIGAVAIVALLVLLLKPMLVKSRPAQSKQSNARPGDTDKS